MIKNTIIALVTATALFGAAAPAFAETSSAIGNNNDEVGEFDNGSYHTAAQNVLTRLRDKGVNATSVEAWGGLVRAFVTTEDGSRVMQLFAPDTLEQVSL